MKRWWPFIQSGINVGLLLSLIWSFSISVRAMAVAEDAVRGLDRCLNMQQVRNAEFRP